MLSPETIKAAFPDATDDAVRSASGMYTDRYDQLGQAFRASQEALGVAAITGSSADTAEAVLRLMHASPESGSLDQLGSSKEAKHFSDTVKSAHTATAELMKVTGAAFGELPLLSSPEFKNIDWQRLLEASKVYEQLGIPATVVFAPSNRPLDGANGWRAFFSNLRQWQDTANPGTSYKLKHQADGDGLWVSDTVANEWDTRIDQSPTAPQWEVSIVPSTDTPTVTQVSYDSTDSQGNVPTSLSNLVAFLPPTPSSTPNQPPKLAGHPTPETILTIHALTHYHNKTHIITQSEQSPIDSNTYTWADGTLQNGAVGLVVDWFPGLGRVFLHGNVVGDRYHYLGVRPAVRG